jgi:predicted nucleic acid-binding protein
LVRYFPDTSALIDAGKLVQPVASTFQSWMDSNEEIGVCAVQLAEFFSGVEPSKRHVANLFLNSLDFWPISDRAARNAGVMRYDLARRGVQVSLPDALIAAVALENSAVIVTSNVRHFEMLDVELLDPRYHL